MTDQRWHLRFRSFCTVLAQLEEAAELSHSRALSDLERAGMVQLFELSWELGWKVVRDYLSDAGMPLDIPSPINAIRGGMAANLVADGDGWVEAMKARNRMAHEYDRVTFERLETDIAGRYLPLLAALRQRLEPECAK